MYYSHLKFKILIFFFSLQNHLRDILNSWALLKHAAGQIWLAHTFLIPDLVNPLVMKLLAYKGLWHVQI